MNAKAQSSNTTWIITIYILNFGKSLKSGGAVIGGGALRYLPWTISPHKHTINTGWLVARTSVMAPFGSARTSVMALFGSAGSAEKPFGTVL